MRVLTLIILASAMAAMGQQPSQPEPGAQPAPAPSPSPAPPSNTPGTPGRTPTQPSPFPSDRQTQSPQERIPPMEMQQPIFLSGKVMLDDGTPPSEQVVIERVCNGVARPEAYTDTKGRFSFQLGQSMGMMPDASVGSAADSGIGMGGPMTTSQRTGGFGNPRGGITEQQLMACELRASLPGHRSEVVSLAGRRAFDNPDVGVIILHRLGKVDGTLVSVTSLNAPKDAKKAYQKGVEAMKKRKVADAQKQLQKAVAAYPRYAAAWYELGVAHEAQKNTMEARKCFNAALEADAKFLKPYLALSMLSAGEKNWKEVADTTSRLIKLDPFDYPQAYFFNSVANYNLGNMEEAEKSAREAQKLDTDHRFPKVNHLLGVILASRRDYSGAAEAIRSYLKFAPNASDAAAVRTQLGEIEKAAAAQPAQQP